MGHISNASYPNGGFPYRMALAGGWIDQPFVSSLNPEPSGSMVVVSLSPIVRYMDRCGMATGTRKVALKIWNGELPGRDPAALARELYAAENDGLTEPSGSQDMIGLIYPGVSRLDYDHNYAGGYFPAHIESNRDKDVAAWIDNVFYMIPINQRPVGYNPLGIKNLDREYVRRLGQSGKDCYDAIINKDIARLGASMNECMICWEALLPHTVNHPTLDVPIKEILAWYQSQYPGAMYSGCGGGYLYVVSETPVPGGMRVKTRLE
jgi:galactokinase/mevalonate kinase-like predicted kinase